MSEENKSTALPTVTISVDDLPSKGIAYPKGVTFTYTGYTYGEVQMTSSSKKMSYVDILRKALSGIRVSGAFMNPNDITFFDMLYLAIARKLSTLGANDFEITTTCDAKKCGKEFTKVFSNIDIKFKGMELEFLPVEITLATGQTLQFSPFTIGDFFELAEGGQLYKVMDSKKGLYDDPLCVKAAQVRNMKFLEAYEIIKNVTDPDDSEVLDELDAVLVHNIEPLSHKCEHCGKENLLQLEGKESLIKPFRPGRQSLRDRIRPVKRAEHVTLAPEANGVLRGDDLQQKISGTP